MIFKDLAEAVKQPEGVTSLNLNNQYFEKFPTDIFRLPDLTSLSLNNTGIQELPAEMASFKKLRELHLRMNPIRSFQKSAEYLMSCPALKRIYLDICFIDKEEQKALKELGRTREIELSLQEQNRNCGLSQGIIQQIERLGGSLEMHSEATKTRSIMTRKESYPLKETYRQVHEDVKWPTGSFKGAIDGFDIWMVQFGTPYIFDNPAYKCSQQTYFHLGVADGGNYILLLAADELTGTWGFQSNPDIFILDHEDFNEMRPTRSHKLNDFLKSLKPE